MQLSVVPGLRLDPVPKGESPVYNIIVQLTKLEHCPQIKALYQNKFTEIDYCNIQVREYSSIQERYTEVFSGKDQNVCNLPLSDLERKNIAL